mmetsp:Transcript_17594/g.61883  ORF Transcript_17594/g.61883 Transcript_17594/m.61883 type:complete len:345 (+) Transcript_17594:2509-3543(+)
MRMSCSTASPHLARASGSDRCSASRCRAGRICGRNGAASCGCSTRRDMLAVMTAHMRLMAAPRRARPRCSRGTTSARAGVSTVDTKVSDASLLIVSGMRSGSRIASTRSVTNGDTSRLSTVLQHACAATLAASTTLEDMSWSTEDMSGTRYVSSWATCIGAISATSVSHSSAATLVPTALSSFSDTTTAGSVATATVGLTRTTDLSASSALPAAGSTALWRAPIRKNGSDAMASPVMNGSTARPRPLHRPSNSIIDAVRANGFFFLCAASSMRPRAPQATNLAMPAERARSTSCCTTGGSGRAMSMSSSFCISHIMVSSSTATETSVGSAAGLSTAAMLLACGW